MLLHHLPEFLNLVRRANFVFGRQLRFNFAYAPLKDGTIARILSGFVHGKPQTREIVSPMRIGLSVKLLGFGLLGIKKCLRLLFELFKNFDLPVFAIDAG